MNSKTIARELVTGFITKLNFSIDSINNSEDIVVRMIVKVVDEADERTLRLKLSESEAVEAITTFYGHKPIEVERVTIYPFKDYVRACK